MQTRCYLYCLIDPRCPEHIRYIGITRCDLKLRLARHFEEAAYKKSNSYKNNWVRGLIHEGVRPEILLIDSLPSWEAACKSEIETIKELKALGYKLVNMTDGGEGVTKGNKRSPETVEKLRLAPLGKKQSEETKRKRSEALKGRKQKPRTEQHLLNMSLSRRGKPTHNKGKKWDKELGVYK